MAFDKDRRDAIRSYAPEKLKDQVRKIAGPYLQDFAEEALKSIASKDLKSSIDFWRKKLGVKSSPTPDVLVFYGDRDAFDKWVDEYRDKGKKMEESVILNKAAVDGGAGALIVAMGLALMVAGYLVYRRKQEAEAQQKAKSAQPGTARTAPTTTSAQPVYLVLQINADRNAAVIEALKEAGHLGVDGLERAIRKLWVGRAPFDPERLRQHKVGSETTEYDVHLVMVELGGQKTWPSKDAYTTDRSRALEALSAAKHPCEVSGRLKIGVASKQGFYEW